MNEVEIQLGLPQRYRRQAAELCYEAFRQKFEPILGAPEHGVAILETGLKSDLILIAVQQDQLVGMVGLEHGDQDFFNLNRTTFIDKFGRLRGLIRMMLFTPFVHHHRDGDLIIGAIAVSPKMRGQGIGTKLLQAVFDYAGTHKLQSISLEVVDTNPHAQRLYERLGFVAIKTRHYPYLKRLMGFSAAATMIKRL